MKLFELLLKMGLISQGSLFYIGGSDVLPPPLKGREEQETLVRLLSRIRDNLLEG